MSRGQRVLRSAPVRIGLGVAALVGLSFGAHQLRLALLGAGVPGLAAAALAALALVVLAGAVYRTGVRTIEARAPSELAGPRAGVELGLGLLIGAGLIGSVVGVIALGGGYAVDGAHGPEVLFAPILMAASSAVLEELLMRGVIFRVLEERLGTWIALTLSSALFGAAHLGNPHATLGSALAIALEAGTLLGLAFVVTRRLWFPIGIHAGWNFTQAGVFGVAVSGDASFQGLLLSHPRGPDWLSGGLFGAEASLVAVGVCCAAAAALGVRAALRGHMLAPAWKRPRLVIDAPAA
jgi:membrane protease YdiL (CAAX protease family)